MSKRRSNTRLFEADGYTFKCWIDPLEAAEKYNRGELDLAVHETSGEAIGYRLRDAFQKSDPTCMRPSQSSITLTECFLNVGLPQLNRQVEPSRSQIQAAQMKIACWPFVWDEKATKILKNASA